MTAPDEPVQAYPAVPPVCASSRANDPDFHPSCARIGVYVDGVRAPDCFRYDARRGRWWSVNEPELVRFGEVTVQWLWEETRQQRRARESWDAKHPQPPGPVPKVVRRETEGHVAVCTDGDTRKSVTVESGEAIPVRRIGALNAVALAIAMGALK